MCSKDGKKSREFRRPSKREYCPLIAVSKGSIITRAKNTRQPTNLTLSLRAAYAGADEVQRADGNQRNQAASRGGTRQAPILSQPADQQTPKGRHSLQCPQIHTEDAPAQFIGDAYLDERIHSDQLCDRTPANQH